LQKKEEKRMVQGSIHSLLQMHSSIGNLTTASFNSINDKIGFSQVTTTSNWNLLDAMNFVDGQNITAKENVVFWVVLVARQGLYIFSRAVRSAKENEHLFGAFIGPPSKLSVFLTVSLVS